MQTGVAVNNLQLSSNLANVAKYPDKETPFEFRAVNDLLDEKSFVDLRNDIKKSVKLYPKDNDLYKFKQSKDLKSQVPAKKLTPSIRSFIKVMLDELRPCLEKEFGLTLSDDKFDITASQYGRGNYLLCHNDDIKDPSRQQARAVAFVYYLISRPWTEDDGGALVLYDSDATGEPVDINNYIRPKPNNLVVFKTSSISWHSVQEVFCDDEFRLSINGWFHLANPSATCSDANKTTIEPSPYEFLKPIPLDSRMEKFFSESVSDQYLMEKTCYLIRRKFKRNSEISLPNFLVDAKFSEICDALREVTKSDDNLKLVGPYNKRNYKRIKVECLPQVCRDLYDAFRSELFFMLLSRFTGLDLQPPHLVNEKQIQDESSDDEGDEEDSEDDEEEEQDGKQEKGAELDEDNQESQAEPQAEESETQDEPTNQVKLDEQSKLDNRTPDKPSKRKRDCDPLTRLEFRHLDAGSYTLIHDHGFELGERSALDVILHFNHDFDVRIQDGGYLSYIDVSDDDANGEDCELLTVEPKSNCLSLVYRSDNSTCRFMKYITKQHESNFQDLYCVYYERPDDLQLGANHKKMKALDETKGNSLDDDN
jgi:Rps23 Pro-64 3,4-dihydroxylase Tpa1-like proline 4-hydroxylase